MKPLTFSLQQPPSGAVDMTLLRPDNLVGKKTADIESLKVTHGKETTAVGDIFKVSGTDCMNIVIENSTFALDRIGSGMKEGRIDVFGDAGAFTGSHLSGGIIAVAGSTGDHSASSMRGGFLRIGGNCGDYLGSRLPGAKYGMNEGCVEVIGDVGIRLADHMRRGLILVHGNTGTGACSAMIAGTVILLGQAVNRLGVHMRRGSIFCAESPHLDQGIFFKQTLAANGTVALVQRRLQELDIQLDLLDRLGTPNNRFVGDLSFGGVGEIFTFSK